MSLTAMGLSVPTFFAPAPVNSASCEKVSTSPSMMPAVVETTLAVTPPS